MFSDILEESYFYFFFKKIVFHPPLNIRYKVPTTFSQLPSYILSARSFTVVRYVAGIIHTQRSSTMLVTPI